MQLSPELRWCFTVHAVERFQQRFVPELAPDRARARMVEVFADAFINQLLGNDGYGCPPREGQVYRLFYVGRPPLSFRFIARPIFDDGALVIKVLSPFNRHHTLLAKERGRRRRERQKGAR